MKKIDIEGIKISYKNVTHLNQKVKDVLLKIQRKREKLHMEFNGIRKKERGLKKFLGLEEESKETQIL